MVSRFMLRSRISFWFLLMVLTALLPLGCKGKCRQLSERLCDCEPSSFAKDDCNRRASSEESRVKPTPQDELRCDQLLKTCDCHTIDTDQGKFNCGLARTRPQ
jgi:hypothetical protein